MPDQSFIEERIEKVAEQVGGEPADGHYEREEVIECITQLVEFVISEHTKEFKEKIIKEIDKNKKTPNYQRGGDWEKDEGYNQAIAEIREKIKSL